MSEVKVSVQELSPVEKRLDVEVPASIVDEAFREAVRKVGKRAKVPGFRPGKIPQPVLERMYGPQIADEVALQVINQTYFDALKDKQIHAVDLPKINNEAAARGADFKYSATVEILPAVELKAYTGLEATIGKFNVTDPDVDGTIERLRESRAELVEVEDKRPIKKEDYAVVNLTATEGGKPVPELSSQGFTIPVGGGVIFPEIEQALEGMQVGESKDLEVTVPDDVQNKRLAGKTFDFHVDVQGLKEKSLPIIDDEFAKDLGEDYETLADLKKKIREDLERHMVDQKERRERELAIDALVAANPLDVPAGLVAKETDNLVHRATHEYENQGIDVAKIDTSMLWSRFRPIAERNIRSELLLDAVSKAEKIEIDDAALEAFFAEEAERRQATPEAIRAAYLRSGADLKDRLRLDKALKLVVSKTKWQEETMAEATKPEEKA